jgi:hypothetical protein
MIAGGLACATLLPAAGRAVELLAPGDFIIAIDTDEVPDSRYPTDNPEGPMYALDNFTLTKYLNFGEENSGLIVTPAFGSTTVQSMIFTSANDEPPRDPTVWELYGTNDTIQSTDNSDGMGGETWTLIETGTTGLTLARETPGPLRSFSNSNSYSSYRFVFPTVRNAPVANSMQIADIQLFESNDGSGFTVLDLNDPVLAIDTDGLIPDSAYPGAEGPANAINGTLAKYLNFGKENSGFIVTPSVGSSVIDSFQITTANDFEGRDPSSFELYGTNDAIVSEDNSLGNGESWTLIESGALALPVERDTLGEVVNVTNMEAYNSYRMVFPTVKDPMGDLIDSLQIAEIQFFGEAVAGPDGDFNNDGMWDCDDIDALVAAIAGGSTDLGFDMNGDGVITAADVTDDPDGWLTVGGANNPGQTSGNAFLVGDANLDGTVDGLDFIEWNTNKFTSTAAWCAGDFTADGTVDGLDFIEWNANKFTSSSDQVVVPEPGLGLLGLISLACFGASRRRAH